MWGKPLHMMPISWPPTPCLGLVACAMPCVWLDGSMKCRLLCLYIWLLFSSFAFVLSLSRLFFLSLSFFSSFLTWIVRIFLPYHICWKASRRTDTPQNHMAPAWLSPDLHTLWLSNSYLPNGLPWPWMITWATSELGPCVVSCHVALTRVSFCICSGLPSPHLSGLPTSLDWEGLACLRATKRLLYYHLPKQNETKQNTSFTLKFYLQFYLSYFLTFKGETANCQDLACRSVWFGLHSVCMYLESWFSTFTSQLWIFDSLENQKFWHGWANMLQPQLAGAE